MFDFKDALNDDVVNKTRVEAFEEFFTKEHYAYLAYYASFPTVLTSDLLYKIWLNFKKGKNEETIDIPVTAVGEFLSSPICREIGRDLYQIYTPIRSKLREELDKEERLPSNSSYHLARFLEAYLKYNPSRIPSAVFKEAQEMEVLFVLDEHQALERIIEQFNNTIETEEDSIEVNYLLSLVQQRSQSLGDNNQENENTPAPFQLVESFMQGLKAFYKGQKNKAEAYFEKLDLSKAEKLQQNQKALSTRIPRTVIHEFKSVFDQILRNPAVELIIEEAKKSQSTKLDLSDQNLYFLPSEITELTFLEEIDLSRNHLVELPDTFKQLQNLYSLNLSHNEFEFFPKVIGQINQTNESTSNPIKKLDISFNRLASLSDAIGMLSDLEDLNLAQNDLVSLPAQFTTLKKLQVVNLANNKFKSIPENLPNESLKGLILENNQIVSIKVADLALFSVELALYLSGNPLIYQKLVEKATEGLNALTIYLNDIEKVEASPPSLLIIDQDSVHLKGLSEQLEEQDFLVFTASNQIEANPILYHEQIDIILITVDETNSTVQTEKLDLVNSLSNANPVIVLGKENGNFIEKGAIRCFEKNALSGVEWRIYINSVLIRIEEEIREREKTLSILARGQLKEVLDILVSENNLLKKFLNNVILSIARYHNNLNSRSERLISSQESFIEYKRIAFNLVELAYLIFPWSIKDSTYDSTIPEQLKSDLEQLIRSNYLLEPVFQKFATSIGITHPVYKELSVLWSSFSELKQQEAQGFIDSSEKQIELNKILFGLLELISPSYPSTLTNHSPSDIDPNLSYFEIAAMIGNGKIIQAISILDSRIKAKKSTFDKEKWDTIYSNLFENHFKKKLGLISRSDSNKVKQDVYKRILELAAEVIPFSQQGDQQKDTLRLDYLRDLLAEQEFEKIFKITLQFYQSTANQNTYEQLILLQAWWLDLKKERMKGLLDYEEINSETNRIQFGLGELIKKFDPDQFKGAQLEPPEREPLLRLISRNNFNRVFINLLYLQQFQANVLVNEKKWAEWDKAQINFRIGIYDHEEFFVASNRIMVELLDSINKYFGTIFDKEDLQLKISATQYQLLLQFVKEYQIEKLIGALATLFEGIKVIELELLYSETIWNRIKSHMRKGLLKYQEIIQQKIKLAILCIGIIDSYLGFEPAEVSEPKVSEQELAAIKDLVRNHSFEECFIKLTSIYPEEQLDWEQNLTIQNARWSILKVDMEAGTVRPSDAQLVMSQLQRALNDILDQYF